MYLWTQSPHEIMEVIGIQIPYMERLRLSGALRSPTTHVGAKSQSEQLDTHTRTITNCISSYRDVTRIIKIILKIV